MQVLVRHNTVAVAMANLCHKAGMTQMKYHDDPRSPVAGRVDVPALEKLRRLPYVMSIEETTRGE